MKKLNKFGAIVFAAAAAATPLFACASASALDPEVTVAYGVAGSKPYYNLSILDVETYGDGYVLVGKEVQGDGKDHGVIRIVDKEFETISESVLNADTELESVVVTEDGFVVAGRESTSVALYNMDKTLSVAAKSNAPNHNSILNLIDNRTGSANNKAFDTANDECNNSYIVFDANASMIVFNSTFESTSNVCRFSAELPKLDGIAYSVSAFDTAEDGTVYGIVKGKGSKADGKTYLYKVNPSTDAQPTFTEIDLFDGSANIDDIKVNDGKVILGGDYEDRPFINIYNADDGKLVYSDGTVYDETFTGSSVSDITITDDGYVVFGVRFEGDGRTSIVIITDLSEDNEEAGEEMENPDTFDAGIVTLVASLLASTGAAFFVASKSTRR